MQKKSWHCDVCCGAMIFFKKVLTERGETCIILQVGGRQREHSTADSDETNEAKLLRKKNFEKFLTKQTH